MSHAGGTGRAVASWLLALLAALALTVSVVAAYADRAVFSQQGFVNRVDAALRSDAVSAAAGRNLADAAIAARPDLVAVRPLVTTAAQAAVRSGAFRSIVRGAAADVHRSVFDRDATTVTLTIGDAGLLLADAIGHQRPDLAKRVPASLTERLASVHGDADRIALRALKAAQRVRLLAIFALLAALALAAAAVLVGPSRRVALTRLSVAVVAFGAVALGLAGLTPRLIAANAATRAVLEAFLDPLTTWCWALIGVGAIGVLAATAAVRPIEVVPLVRRAGASALRPAADPRLRALRAVVAIALGVVAILWPAQAVRVLTVSAGLALLLTGVGELFRLVAPPQPLPIGRRLRRLHAPGRRGRIALLAAALALAVVAAGGLASAGVLEPLRVGRCNGSAALCARPLNAVAFVGTHNSMAADGEPGWLFAAQDAGIDAQLADGVRALLIDTHYGFATPRGVATDLSHESASREKVTAEVGERFVETATRLRTRIGYRGGGTRRVFLCHAFCEVGATLAVDALRGVHRFLVRHPEEVLILSIEDDTAPADTAAILRESGLIDEVYRGPATPPWPTLRDMIDSDERVLVLVENHPGAEPWLHKQADVAQETPFHFATAAQLEAPDSCAPNRGGRAGSLLLVNHWVDTSPAPRKTIARVVNAPGVIEPRLARCQAERKLLSTIVAVDFYHQGDVFAAVDRLNAR